MLDGTFQAETYKKSPHRLAGESHPSLLQSRDFHAAKSSLESSTEPSIILDAEGRFLYTNSALERVLGLRCEDLIGESCFDFTHPLDRESSRRRYRHSVEQGDELHHEARAVGADGLVRWFAWSGRFDRRVGFMVARGIDVTGRRRQHDLFESLNQAVSRYSGKEFFEAVAFELASRLGLDRVAVAIRQEDGSARTIAFASPSGPLPNISYALSGTLCEDILEAGNVRMQFVKTERLPSEIRFHGASWLAYVGCPVHSLDRSHALGVIWVAHSKPIEDLIVLEWLLLSFSVRIAAEMERANRERELERQLSYNRALLRASPDILFVFNSDYRVLDCFYHREEELARPAAQLLGQCVDSFLPQDVADRLKRAAEQARQTLQVQTFAYQLETPAGNFQAFEARVLSIQDGSILAFVRNTTKEQRLKVEQERLTDILEASPDIVAVMKADGELAYLNPAGRGYFGIERDADFEKIDLRNLRPAWAVDLLFDEGVPHALKHGVWQGETAYTGVQGREVPFSQIIVAHTSARTGRVEQFSTVLRDISDRKEFETKLKEHQMQMLATAKMAALGEMAAGLAHEINNPLQSITARAQLLGELAGRDGGPLAARVSEFATKIDSMAHRIASIVRSLRFFARDGEKDPFECKPVVQLVDDTLELCRNRFRHQQVTLNVRVNGRDGGPAVNSDLNLECRPVQISQVLLNLLSNAFDAVQPLADRWVRIDVDERGDMIEISVTDSGRGIPSSVAHKIMQPFFTTKEVGVGTGLGLSISRGIVSDHGGQLELDRASEHTRFVIRLPRRQAASPSSTKS